MATQYDRLFEHASKAWGGGNGESACTAAVNAAASEVNALANRLIRLPLPGRAETILLLLSLGDPMRTVPIGTQGSFAMVVSPEHLANRFKDATLPPVLATPVMIMA